MSNYLKMVNLLFVMEVVFGLILPPFKYSQEDSETKCTHGLVSEMDFAVFKSHLNISDEWKKSFVTIYIKRKSEQKFIATNQFNIGQECFTSDYNSSVCKREGSNFIWITIKIRATKDLSLAKIKICLKEDFNIAFSEEQLFPEIFDSTDALGTLKVNGKEIATSNKICYKHFSGAKTEFKFTCESRAMPCLINISAYDPEKFLHSKLENNTVLFDIPYTLNDVRIRINYAACRLDGNVNVHNCVSDKMLPIAERLESDFQQSDLMKNPIVIISATVFAVIIIIILGISIRLIVKKRKDKRLTSIENNNLMKQDGEEIKDEHTDKDTLCTLKER